MNRKCTAEQGNHNGVLLASDVLSPILKRGMERIEKRSPRPVDVLYGRSPEDSLLKGYDWVVVLDEIITTVGDSLEDDAWAIEVSDEKPVQVSIRAQTERARLFALYHIADCLERKLPTDQWAVVRTPLMKRRYAWISGGNCWSDVCRPDWFDRDIEDVPGLGLNGLLMTLTPTHGTSISRQTLPLTLTADGVVADRFKLPAFTQMFDRLKTYGLDLGILYQPYIPPQFTCEDVRDHYDGKTALPDLEPVIEKTSCEMATAVFTHLPQLDYLVFHSLECEWMWGMAVSMFPCKDEDAGVRAFEAYLKGMTRACKEHKKELWFWTHISPFTMRHMRLMHDVLFRFPSVVVIEDHALPNNDWPHLPVMGHIAGDMRDSVTSGRWGMSIITTDGEYYGAGALPTAYPEPHVEATRKAIAMGAESIYFRFNEQSLTPLRTMECINAIHVLAANEQLWEFPRATDAIWRDWAERRYGKQAAPKVISALKKSETILKKGLSAAGRPLIDHSGLAYYAWRPGSEGRAWDVFARPGELLAGKPYDELKADDELGEAVCGAWQVNSRGVTLEEFYRESGEAESAVHEALKEIESVRDKLSPEDFESLSSCFEETLSMMEAIRRAAAGVWYLTRNRENPGEENRAGLEKACAAMEACADQIEEAYGIRFRPMPPFAKVTFKNNVVSGYGVPVSLQVLAEEYRKHAK